MNSSRIVQLAMFSMVGFAGVETALVNSIYSFTTIDAPSAIFTEAHGHQLQRHRTEIAG